MKKIFLYISIVCGLGMVASCSSFFDEDSTYIVDARDNHLGTAADTLYSVIGVLNKLQAIGDRTILLGEARGDLVDVTDVTSKDLRQLATFTVDEDNAYNSPKDYYAIINNCNYFISKVNHEMKNNRNEYVFKSEYAAVKAIRAWTYLQLVTTYGSVPFVTEPIMTAEEAEKEYPRKGIKEVCDYFINEDGLQELAYPAVDFPYYGDIKRLPSRLFYVPVDIILGDLNLWAGNYLKAAEHYYGYITKRNTGSIYPVGNSMAKWTDNTWMNYGGLVRLYNDIWNGANSEVITIIPTDSIPSEGNYSQLRNIFNTDMDTDDRDVELTVSKSLENLSAKQDFCYYNDKTQKAEIAPKTIDKEKYLAGDLRLRSCVDINDNATYGGKTYVKQTIYKQVLSSIRLYRRTLIYLRLAEAMNRAGFPDYAFDILKYGMNSDRLELMLPLYDTSDQEILKRFDFRGYDSRPSNTTYVHYNPETGNGNTIGIHSRGSGFTDMNDNYAMPTGTREEQIKAVEDLIVDEEALEFAFEGYRYYDLLRVALRRTAEPNYLANKLHARRGEGKDSGIIGVIGDVNSKTNWFLNWNGKIGF